jgi:hypothetical protein
MSLKAASPQEFSDLHRLVVLYCRAIDRRDMNLLRTIFHPDAEMDYGLENYQGPITPWYDQIAPALASFDVTQHHITNSYFEVDGSYAEGESYLIAYHPLKGRPNDFYIAGGRYLDKFERRADGVWRILKRTALRDWENTSSDLSEPNLGRADKSDLSYTAITMFVG